MKNSVSTLQAIGSLSLNKVFIISYLWKKMLPKAGPGSILFFTLQTRPDMHLREGKTVEIYPYFLL